MRNKFSIIIFHVFESILSILGTQKEAVRRLHCGFVQLSTTPLYAATQFKKKTCRIAFIPLEPKNRAWHCWNSMFYFITAWFVASRTVGGVLLFPAWEPFLSYSVRANSATVHQFLIDILTALLLVRTLSTVNFPQGFFCTQLGKPLISFKTNLGYSFLLSFVFSWKLCLVYSTFRMRVGGGGKCLCATRSRFAHALVYTLTHTQGFNL